MLQRPAAEERIVVRSVAWRLLGVVASLITVGLISDTLARHVVQVAPLLLALGLLTKRPATGAWFAVPVLSVWLAVMAAIWLYLAGLSEIADGTYSTAEVALTFIIAACSVWAIPMCLRLGRPLPIYGRFTAALGGLALQVGTLAMSLRYFA